MTLNQHKPSLLSQLGINLYHGSNRLEAKLYGFDHQVVEVDQLKIKLWKNEQKERDTLVLLHGFSASHAVWLRMAKRLSKEFNILIPDLPGHGESTRDASLDYSISAQVERIIQLLKLKGLEKVIVIGNSMGGFMAAHMALHYPQYCKKIVLIDPAGVATPEPSTMKMQLMEGQNPFFVSSYQEFKAFFAMVMAKPPWFPAIAIKGVAALYIDHKPLLEKVWADFNNNGDYLTDKLENISVPSLLLWGAKDELIHVSGVETWQNGLNGEVHVWNDLGHMPMLENPKDCAQKIREFISL